MDDMLKGVDMSGPPPDLPNPDLIPLAERLAAVDRAIALPARTTEAVRAAVGPAMLKECPSVCAMLEDPAVDLQRLRAFLALAHRVERGSISETKASERVGTELFKDYCADRR